MNLRLTILALVLFPLTLPAAEKQPVKPSKTWTGSVDDADLAKKGATVIVSQKKLDQLWKDWSLPNDPPKVDFTKELVVTATSRGSKLSLSLNLTDKGNLTLGVGGTRDLRPGFRYVIASVSRDGVKTVNGKDLPKE